MRVLLVDVDSKIPNLVLMKLSTYHKSLGDCVTLIKLQITYYPEKNKLKVVNAGGFDKVYVSCIFQTNKNNFIIENCDDVEVGGTGIDFEIKLPEYIDELDEDYSLYDTDTSYGFITRGCIRNCYFCFVPKKEGSLKFYRSVERIVKHKKVEFMDNNILAYDKHIEILQELVDKNIRCSFNQGLDLRLITEDNAKLLSELNYDGEYTFAFDDIKYLKIINEKYNILKKYIDKDWKIRFFVYCNSNMEISEVTDRLNWLKEHKCLPYLMRDINCFDSNYKDFYTDLSAYCNQPSFFKKMEFETFVNKRLTDLNRKIRDVRIYKGLDDKSMFIEKQSFEL